MGADPVADFSRDHAEEQRIAGWEGWANVYRAVFPRLVSCDRVTDLAEQRAGIDRRLVLADGRALTFDEKYDAHDERNFFLETWSDEERAVPGWLTKGAECDYVAYLFRASRSCYFLPYGRLVAAWREHGAVWQAMFGIKRIANGRYTTAGVPVRIGLVTDAIGGCNVARLLAGLWVRRPA